MTTFDLALEAGHVAMPSRQRSARNDAAMRDGDSGHGNPYEYAAVPGSTDADIGDARFDNEDFPEMPTGWNRTSH